MVASALKLFSVILIIASAALAKAGDRMQERAEFAKEESEIRENNSELKNAYRERGEIGRQLLESKHKLRLDKKSNAPASTIAADTADIEKNEKALGDEKAKISSLTEKGHDERRARNQEAAEDKKQHKNH